MFSEMADSTEQGLDRTEVGIARTGMNDLLTTDGILLVGKRQQNRGGRGKIRERSSKGRKVTLVVAESHITQPKRGAERVGIGWFRIFAWTTQEIERDEDEVRDSETPRITALDSCGVGDPQQDKRNGLDAIRFRV